jgi:hypothetical protein
MRFNAITRGVSAVCVAAPLIIVSSQTARAQGCIVARSSGSTAGPTQDGGYLAPGEWEITEDYRHQFSQRHFVGDVEQTYRMQQGTQVMNKINLLTTSITYQATPRFSFTADVPLLFASRRSNNSPYTTTAQGIGDISFSARGWIFDPRENSRGNVGITLGFSAPTGRDDVTNVVDSFDGKGPHPVVLDYSIQPGIGGYGLLFAWQSFLNVASSQLYFDGSYLATPGNTTGVLRTTTPPANPATMTQYASISDEYLLEAGFAHAVPKVRGLTFTVGPRMEGVPAEDLIGDSLGFRRPGYAISIEPGVQYVHGRTILTASVGKAIYRNRTVSVPDRMNGTHGDAAFADYVWLASLSHRFGGHGSHSSSKHSHQQPADAGTM